MKMDNALAPRLSKYREGGGLGFKWQVETGLRVRSKKKRVPRPSLRGSGPHGAEVVPRGRGAEPGAPSLGEKAGERCSAASPAAGSRLHRRGHEGGERRLGHRRHHEGQVIRSRAVQREMKGGVHLSSLQGNLRKISGILSQWCKESMPAAYRRPLEGPTALQRPLAPAGVPLRLERKRGAKPVSVEETFVLKLLHRHRHLLF